MKRIVTLVSLLLALLMLGCCAAVAEGAPAAYELGGQIDDFTVTTYDGQSVTLYDVLKERYGNEYADK